MAVLAAVVLAALGIGVPLALAATIFNYAQGTSGVDGILHHTAGYADRDFNRVYHGVGGKWSLWYEHTDGSSTTPVQGTMNPLTDPNNQYAIAYCFNLTDNTGALWTCQTTHL